MADDLHPAFRSYATLDAAAPEGDTLNLAWTRDEREYLAVDLATVLADELRAEADRELRREPRSEPAYLDRYLVRDPFGEQTLGPSVAAAFGLSGWRGHITCGAGVVSLLHGLARLAAGGAIRIVGDTYPDFPYYVVQQGGTCGASPAAALWFVERPSLIGDAFADHDELAALCHEAARHDAIVIVDESNANYYPPTWSAVGLALAHDNLVVIRGFSKAYGLGGLRLAFAIATSGLTERVRSVVPPLLASSLSLRLGARVVALGDLAAPLRTRISTHEHVMIELLERAGVEVVRSSEHLPYVLSRTSGERLAARGVLGKHHPMWWTSRGGVADIYRLSIPLNAKRFARLRELLQQDPQA